MIATGTDPQTKSTADTAAPTGTIDEIRGEDVRVLLGEMNERLARMDEFMGGLERRVAALDELTADLMPMANGMFDIASGKLEEWEREGALEFGREAAKLAETVATSFTAEDVRLLGQNLVGILETVRSMTQPEVLDVADRAVGALREAEAQPPQKVRFFKALRDPEVRRGMGLMLSVLREMGADHENEPNGSSAKAATAT